MTLPHPLSQQRPCFYTHRRESRTQRAKNQHQVRECARPIGSNESRAVRGDAAPSTSTRLLRLEFLAGGAGCKAVNWRQLDLLVVVGGINAGLHFLHQARAAAEVPPPGAPARQLARALRAPPEIGAHTAHASSRPSTMNTPRVRSSRARQASLVAYHKAIRLKREARWGGRQAASALGSI